MTDYNLGLCLLHSLGLGVLGIYNLSKRSISGTDPRFRLVSPASQAIRERPASARPMALCAGEFDRLMLSRPMIERSPHDPAVVMAFA